MHPQTKLHRFNLGFYTQNKRNYQFQSNSTSYSQRRSSSPSRLLLHSLTVLHLPVASICGRRLCSFNRGTGQLQHDTPSPAPFDGNTQPSPPCAVRHNCAIPCADRQVHSAGSLRRSLRRSRGSKI